MGDTAGALFGGAGGGLCTTGLQTWCNTNHAGSGSNSRQAGCFPRNWCGSGEDDAFDEAEAKARERKKKLAAAAAGQQPKPTPLMSRPSDATTAVGSLSKADGASTPPKLGAELSTLEEGGGSGGLATSPVVQSLERSTEVERITREELQAKKDLTLLDGEATTGGLASSPIVQGLERSAGGEGLTREELVANKASAQVGSA